MARTTAADGVEDKCPICAPSVKRSPYADNCQRLPTSPVLDSRGVRILDAPSISAQEVWPSRLVNWLLKLAVVAVIAIAAREVLLPLAIALVLRYLVPVLLFGTLFTMLASRLGGGLGCLLGLALWRAMSGPPQPASPHYATMTTFLGDNGRRRRHYELISRHPPMVEQGDVVRVIGIPLPGHIQVLALWSDAGLVLRRGLLSVTSWPWWSCW